MSFELKRGKTLCVVGESGSGKSVTARSVLQIVDKPGRIEGGSILLTRADGSMTDLAKLDARGKDIRGVRGKEIAMIFQEPMSSLSPVHRIGTQIGEGLRIHFGLSKKDQRERVLELLRQVEIPRPENRDRPLHVRVFRRHATAGDDRHGAGLQSAGADRR